MNLIEKLGLEKCKQIVDGAPKWAAGFCLELSVYASSSKGNKLHITSLADIRAALADHDRTDYVADIKNHISPTTVVIER